MLQLQIEHCQRDEADLISELLEDAGAVSITMTDKYDDAILEPELGTCPLWPHVVIQSLFTENDLAHHALQSLAAHYSHVECTMKELPEQDWERVCMVDFKPLHFGKRLWICPSWLTPPEPDAVNLILDPGLAFGTGTHQTTSLCLRWLEQADLVGKDIIDFGCGSGILALAALKLGAKHAYAVDIDQQALIATRSNAENNTITDAQLTAGYPDILKTPTDLLIANILLSPLLTLKEQFHRLLNNGGTLVVSGILEDQVESLIDAYQGIFTHHSSMLDNGWALVVFKRQG